ncbi:MAG: GNAT family N-acetyltransferase [Pseudomonadales bacterium]|nr:GNAT family N-acetyltransferase [Pseudomonadales bacterium]
MKNMKVDIISLDDNLQDLAEQINQSSWDDENEVEDYSGAALQAYLEKEDTVFIVCYLVENDVQTLAGMSSGRIEQKPYNFSKWLYIDEVDTCSNHRQKGVATAMMETLLKFAKDKGCEEVWLGTETDNLVARRFYESLDPDDIDDVIGYTFELD